MCGARDTRMLSVQSNKRGKCTMDLHSSLARVSATVCFYSFVDGVPPVTSFYTFTSPATCHHDCLLTIDWACRPIVIYSTQHLHGGEA